MHGMIVVVVAIAAAALLSWQRDRSRFQLARMAMERGLAGVPGMPPAWLGSMRNALSMLIIGVALMVIGVAAIGMSRKVPPPPADVTHGQPASPAATTEPAPPAPITAAPQPPPPPDDDHGPADHGPHARGPHPGAPQPPPPLDPAADRWRRAMDRETIGLQCLAIGFVLTLLGLVRVGVARAEMRYTQTMPPAMSATMTPPRAD